MKIARLVFALAVAALTATLGAFEAQAQTAAPVEAHNVVLVHGAWADGSSWAEVIPLLQAAGLKVTAVQNPLTSLEDSVAATRRALALQDGPTVLVAHSWGGTVISETGIDPKVTALSMLPREPPTLEKILLLSPENFRPERCAPASRSTMDLQDCPRSPSSNILPMASSPERPRCFMRCRNLPPRLCSAGVPQWPPGAPSRHGTRCRNSIRPSILIWNAFWQNA